MPQDKSNAAARQAYRPPDATTDQFPHSRASEVHVLSWVLDHCDPSILSRVTKEDFHVPDNRRLYTRLVELGARLSFETAFEAVAGTELSVIVGECKDVSRWPPLEIEPHIRELHALRHRREVMRAGAALYRTAIEANGDLSDRLATAFTSIDEVRAPAEGDESLPSARTWRQLKEAELPSAERVFGPLRRSEVGMLTARSNVGKTTLAFNFALSVASGQAFGEIIPAGRPRRVLYVDAETPPLVLREDIARMIESLAPELEALIDENLIVIDQTMLPYGETLCLTDRRHMAWLEGEARRVRADVLILDTLASVFEIYSENDNAELQRRVVKPSRALAVKLNVAVCVLHHEGKGDQSGRDAQDRPRGGSSLIGGARIHWTIKRDLRSDGQVILEMGKVKGDQQGEVVLHYDHAARWYSPTAITPPTRPLSLEEKVVRAVSQEMSLAGVLGLFPDANHRTVQEYLRSAVNRGLLERTGRGWYAPK
jgi:hypothetical protein